MKTKTNIFYFFLVALLAGLPVLGHADNHAPPAPGVLETWACNYNSGQDQGDLMAARDYYVKQAGKAGLELSPAFVWNAFKGAVPMDFLWMSPHENLDAFAAFSDAFAGAADLSGVAGRFDAVASCRPGLNTITQVHTREAEVESDLAHIVSFACDFNEGMSARDLPDLRGHIGAVMKSMGDNAPNASYMVQPITGGADVRDVYMFSVYNNVSAWSKFIGELLPSEAGQSMIRHFSVVLDCAPACCLMYAWRANG